MTTADGDDGLEEQEEETEKAKEDAGRTIEATENAEVFRGEGSSRRQKEKSENASGLKGGGGGAG